ncbi:MAG TPA: hypothetical protein VL688_06455 [Verrucomicrobiae bacterium]|jgi:hypothetical protein|nr:hypothetical protein [Verrucomicrobiae bacterium]
MATKTLRPLPSGKVTIFKISNRRGFAAVCMRNLTEGRSADQAFQRMAKAVRRAGYELRGKVPKAKA